MNISRLVLMMAPLFLVACGGGGGGGGGGGDSAGAGPDATTTVNSEQEATATTVPVDGANVELESDSDGFIVEGDVSKASASLTAPSDHTFKPSKLKTLTIVSGSATPCHMNIYSRYSLDDSNAYVPAGDSKVLQAYSADCSYTGRLYAMKHWDGLLLEVIDGSLTGAASYYELTVDAGSIAVNIN
ncbi:hypothetical protein [Alkalimarinus sediminis]|uniref:Lipoprotein n=1 Tax=Alkalimarinus sediminis TaxID=1632866 RepID=A0A9E8KPS9_9ALTE|nr:hypothetical protein [Alkalimarinus sediminis]UZW74495.1 hypothetical protein NNL22_15945 [Alkalimarinus sediminis]